MFLREYCIHNLHKIISHYLFHLPLRWKSQLKENKFSCLFGVSLLGPTTTGPVYSLSAMLAVTWCDVLKYKPKCNSCYLPQQTYYPLFSLPLPPSHKTYLSWLHSCSLHYSSTLGSPILLCFICSVYIVSFFPDLLSVYFIHIQYLLYSSGKQCEIVVGFVVTIATLRT